MALAVSTAFPVGTAGGFSFFFSASFAISSFRRVSSSSSSSTRFVVCAWSGARLTACSYERSCAGAAASSPPDAAPDPGAGEDAPGASVGAASAAAGVPGEPSGVRGVLSGVRSGGAPVAARSWSWAHWCTSPANLRATCTRMMLNLESTFPSSTQRYRRFPRYSTCADRNASSALSARPGAEATSWSQPSEEARVVALSVSRTTPPASPNAPHASRKEVRGDAAGDAPRVKIAGGDGSAGGGANGDRGSGGACAGTYRLRMASTEDMAASTASLDVCS